jgi:uncharacterized membrane protein
MESASPEEKLANTLRWSSLGLGVAMMGRSGGRPRSAKLGHPSLLLGIGFGGFIDGIVLHQILQWRHMLSAEGCCPTSTVLGLEDNTLADGFFHVATWIVLMAGTILAMRAWQRGELAPPWGAHVAVC